jgi:hypothetical protein
MKESSAPSIERPFIKQRFDMRLGKHVRSARPTCAAEALSGPCKSHRPRSVRRLSAQALHRFARAPRRRGRAPKQGERAPRISYTFGVGLPARPLALASALSASFPVSPQSACAEPSSPSSDEPRGLLAPLAERPPGASEGNSLFVGFLIDGADSPSQLLRDMPRRLCSPRCFTQCAHFPCSPFLA